MNTLIIRKKSLKTWLHIDSVLGSFIISKFYFNADGLSFQIVEQGLSKRVIYNVTNITLYDDTTGGGAETFTSILDLSLRLEVLKYPAFQYDGQFSTPNLQEVTDVGSVTSNPINVSDDDGISGVALNKDEGVGLNNNSHLTEAHYLKQSEYDGVGDTFSSFQGTSTGGLIAQCVFAFTEQNTSDGFVNLTKISNTTTTDFNTTNDFIRDDVGGFISANFISYTDAIANSETKYHTIHAKGENNSSYNAQMSYDTVVYVSTVKLITTNTGAADDLAFEFGGTIIITEHYLPI